MVQLLLHEISWIISLIYMRCSEKNALGVAVTVFWQTATKTENRVLLITYFDNLTLRNHKYISSKQCGNIFIFILSCLGCLPAKITLSKETG